MNFEKLQDAIKDAQRQIEIESQQRSYEAGLKRASDAADARAMSEACHGLCEAPKNMVEAANLVAQLRVKATQKTEVAQPISDQSKKLLARIQSLEAERNQFDGLFKLMGDEGHDIDVMLKAIDAGIVAMTYPTNRLEREAYLRRRQWILESPTSWRHLPSGLSCPYEIAVKRQIDDDQAPFTTKAKEKAA